MALDLVVHRRVAASDPAVVEEGRVVAATLVDDLLDSGLSGLLAEVADVVERTLDASDVLKLDADGGVGDGHLNVSVVGGRP